MYLFDSFVFAKQNALVCWQCFVFANHTVFVGESLGIFKTCFVGRKFAPYKFSIFLILTVLRTWHECSMRFLALHGSLFLLMSLLLAGCL